MISAIDEEVPTCAASMLRMLVSEEGEDTLMMLDCVRHLCVIGYRSFAHSLTLRADRQRRPATEAGGLGGLGGSPPKLLSLKRSSTLRRTMSRGGTRGSMTNFDEIGHVREAVQSCGSKYERAIVDFFEAFCEGHGRSADHIAWSVVGLARETCWGDDFAW